MYSPEKNFDNYLKDSTIKAAPLYLLGWIVAIIEELSEHNNSMKAFLRCYKRYIQYKKDFIDKKTRGW